MVPVTELVRQRLSTVIYDSTTTVAEATIRELVEYATLAPSSLNLQHWRFIAVTTLEDKQRLQAIAYNQPQVGTAALTFIILGDTEAYKQAPEIMHQAVQSGVLSPETAQSWISLANDLYEDRPDFGRDEAIRSASMAAMILMLVAESKGLATGPMIGFDEKALRQDFAIPDSQVPVMLLTLGKPAPGNWSRKPRLPLNEVFTNR